MIKTYYDYRNSATQSAYCAFDNNLATGFISRYSSTQSYGKITIVFPFPIYIQSIIIKNTSVNPAGRSGIGRIKTGYIYISPNTATANFNTSTSSLTSYTFATLSRSDPTTASYATTHTNDSYTNTAIRSICITGTAWGSGSSSWHIIGEVSINFKVASNDLSSWKSTYSIS